MAKASTAMPSIDELILLEMYSCYRLKVLAEEPGLLRARPGDRQAAHHTGFWLPTSCCANSRRRFWTEPQLLIKSDKVLI